VSDAWSVLNLAILSHVLAVCDLLTLLSMFCWVAGLCSRHSLSHPVFAAVFMFLFTAAFIVAVSPGISIDAAFFASFSATTLLLM
jgi:hypothetical protein